MDPNWKFRFTVKVDTKDIIYGLSSHVLLDKNHLAVVEFSKRDNSAFEEYVLEKLGYDNGIYNVLCSVEGDIKHQPKNYKIKLYSYQFTKELEQLRLTFEVVTEKELDLYSIKYLLHEQYGNCFEKFEDLY